MARTEKLRLTISYDEPDEDGWTVARVVEIPGALTQGRSREEARENVIDALRLMLSPDDDDADVAAGRSEQLDLDAVRVKLRDLRATPCCAWCTQGQRRRKARQMA